MGRRTKVSIGPTDGIAESRVPSISEECTDDALKILDTMHGEVFPEIAFRIRTVLNNEGCEEGGSPDGRYVARDLPGGHKNSPNEEGQNAPEDIDIDQVSDPKKRTRILESLNTSLENLDILTVGGQLLRITQKRALVAFRGWIHAQMNERRLMGYLVYPPGTGKTNLGVLLARMMPGRTVVIAHGNRENIYQAFFDHEKTFPPKKQRTIGQIYGPHCEDDSDVVVTHFASEKKWNNINWKKVDLIIVDEADINGLSPKRAKALRALADQYSIPIVATTATEEQASGRRLSDVFPDEIERMGLPEDLPRALKMGIVSPMFFSDLYLDAEMSIYKSDLERREYPDELVDDLMRKSNWIEQILNDYQRRSVGGPFKKGVVVFRNNVMLEEFVALANKGGIRVGVYKGGMTDRERLEAQERLANGNIDLLIGSRLLGRGLHVPGIEIVYNSTVTRSPQAFWQANGRGGSPDPKNPEKIVEIVAVLPKFVMEVESGRALSIEKKPLSHAAFFDPSYFDQKVIQMPSDVKFDLREIHRGIRSVQEVMEFSQGVRGEGYVSRSRMLSRLIDTMENVNRSTLRRICRSHTSEIRDLWVGLESIARPLESSAEGEVKVPEDDSSLLDDSLFSDHGPTHLRSTEEEPEFSGADQYWIDYANKAPMLNLKQERKLIEKAMQGDKKAVIAIIHAHLPLVISLAKKFTSSAIALSDLVNVALEGVYKLFQKELSVRGGMSSHFMIMSFDRMQHYVHMHSRDVRIPGNQFEGMRTREWRAENRLNELRYGPEEKRRLSESEYLRAIGLAYEEIRFIDSLGGLAQAADFLRDYQYVAYKNFSWFTLFRTDEEKVSAEIKEAGFTEERFLRALKLHRENSFKKLEAILQRFEAVRANKEEEARLIAQYPDQLEMDVNTSAEVNPKEALYDALRVSHEMVEFRDDLPDPTGMIHHYPDAEEKRRRAIDRALVSLRKEQHGVILRLRFGLPYASRPLGEPMDFRSIASLLGYKTGGENIRQIESRALRNLGNVRTLGPFYEDLD